MRPAIPPPRRIGHAALVLALATSLPAAAPAAEERVDAEERTAVEARAPGDRAAHAAPAVDGERAVEARAAAGEATAPAAAPSASPFDLAFSGYGELLFAFHGFGPNQNREGGAQRDARLVFDTTRLVTKLKGRMPLGLEFGAEVEFEHGGTGAELELAYEEFGEFEQEVSHGGEVLVEELYLRKRFGEHLSLTLGRFYVAVGTLPRGHRPTDYLAAGRPEAETSVLPSLWHEMGLQLRAEFERWRLTAQVVNGLDSTGFGSQNWIASGHQTRFELVRASDLAGVGRIDFLPARDVEVGVSAYYGGTSRNRPKPDLVKECDDPDPDEVASCGYVDAPLLLVDLHSTFRAGPLRGTALLLWGRLENAETITQRNSRLSNALEAPRTPVAEEALAAWAELGYDVAPLLGLGNPHALEPFVRFDYYDTMFDVPAGTFDNPRFERKVLTAGLACTLDDAVALKLDGVHRWFGSSELRPETSVRLGAGFVF